MPSLLNDDRNRSERLRRVTKEPGGVMARSNSPNSRDRLNRSGHVAGVRQSDESRVTFDRGDHRRRIDQPVAVGGNDRQPHPLGLGQMVQRTQYAVVLGGRHHDVIARADHAIDCRVESCCPVGVKADALR